MLVWGMLRAAPNGDHAERPDPVAAQGRAVPHARDGHHQRSERVPDARVTVPGAGSVRIAWTSAGGTVFYSRSVAVAAR